MAGEYTYQEDKHICDNWGSMSALNIGKTIAEVNGGRVRSEGAIRHRACKLKLGSSLVGQSEGVRKRFESMLAKKERNKKLAAQGLVEVESQFTDDIPQNIRVMAQSMPWRK